MQYRDTQSFWQRRARRRIDEIDVAVVGAGITGLSIAYWLRQLSPRVKVLVLERSRAGSGASGRNAGFLLQGHATSFAQDVEKFGPENAAMLWHFTLENRDLILDTFNADRIRARACGSLTVAGSADEAGRLERSQELLRQAGIEAKYVGSDILNETLHSRAFFGALEVDTGAVVDPVELLGAIRVESGVPVLEGSVVEDIQPSGDGCIVDTSSAAIYAHRVVVAINAGTPLLLPELSGQVVPRRAQMFATAPMPRILDKPVYSHEGFYYIRQLDSGEVLVGGARHRHIEAEKGYEDCTTYSLQSDLSDYLASHFPWAADHNVLDRWSGTMGFTSDYLPRAGNLKHRGPVTWIGGFSGHGMSMAFLVGKVLAAYVLGAEVHPVLELLMDRGS